MTLRILKAAIINKVTILLHVSRVLTKKAITYKYISDNGYVILFFMDDMPLNYKYIFTIDMLNLINPTNHFG